MTNKRGQIYQRNLSLAYLFLRRHFGSRSTRSGSLVFKMAAMLQIPWSPCILPRKYQSGPMPPSRAKNRRQKSANPALFPRMSPGLFPRMAADKCIMSCPVLLRLHSTVVAVSCFTTFAYKIFLFL